MRNARCTYMSFRVYPGAADTLMRVVRADGARVRDNACGRVKRYATVAMATQNLIRPWNRTLRSRSGFLKNCVTAANACTRDDDGGATFAFNPPPRGFSTIFTGIAVCVCRTMRFVMTLPAVTIPCASDGSEHIGI